MASHAHAAFKENVEDVRRLLEIHSELGGDGPGRRFGLEVLNKSAIVLITASWEAYVEDVAREAFDQMLGGESQPGDWPKKVRALASASLRESKDDSDVWKLAGDGWKQVLKDHRAAVLEKWVGRLDTPKSPKVNDLFGSMLGLRNVTQYWAWQAMSPERATEKLDGYITVRGAIAHRTRHDEAIGIGWVRDFLAHVERLVECTDEAVARHVRETTGVSPVAS